MTNTSDINNSSSLNTQTDSDIQTTGSTVLPTSPQSLSDYRELFENAPLPYQSLDINGKIITVNKAWLSMLGYTKEEVLGTFIGDYLTPESVILLHERFPKFVSQGSVQDAQFEFKTKSGKIIIVSVNGKIQTDEDHHFKATHCILPDVTEKVKLQKELAESKKRWENIFQAISQPVVILSPEFMVLEANNTVLKKTKLTLEEIRGKHCFEIFHYKNHKPDGCPLRGLLESQHPETREMEMELFDGTYLISCTPVFNDEGKLNSIIHIATDITQQKNVENRLKESEKQLIHQIKENELHYNRLEKLLRISEYAANSSQDFMDFCLHEALSLTSSQMGFLAYYDEDKELFTVNSWSKEALDICKIMEPKYAYHLSNSGFWGEAVRQRKPMINNDYLSNTVFNRGLPEGHVPLKNILSLPLFSGNKITALLCVANKKTNYLQTDIVQLRLLMDSAWKILEREKMTEELIEAKEKAVESDRLKSAFLANLSHEIRTPMNGIIGFADLLSSPDLTIEKKEKFIRVIKNSGHYLLSIINDIIEISKIETGQLHFHSSYFNLCHLLQNINDETQMLIKGEKAKNLKLKIHIPQKEVFINSDEIKLRQILINLINNAIKYTPSGTIEVSLTEKPDNYYEFLVKDTGIGIPKEFHALIFDRFRQVDTVIKVKQSGSGLGLSICKAYAEMLGGKIWLESEVDVGSSFHFLIKSVNTVEDKPYREPSVSQSYLLTTLPPLLIVEDDETNYEYLYELLSPYAKTIFWVKNGQESIKTVQENADIRLIFMDIKMPVMDGYEATRKLKKINPELLVIAQTAYTLPEDRNNALNAGCNAHISKPINKNQLYMIINQLLSSKASDKK